MLQEFEEAYNVKIAMEAIEDCRAPFLEFLRHERLPDNLAKKAKKRRGAKKFLILKDILYRLLEDILLRCIENHEI